jgi:hypothetical protein
MSEPNNRPTMRNLILAKSQTSPLINQRCRLSFIAKCVSLSHAVCGCWSTLSSVSINTRTHTPSLSLCLSATLLSFPIFPFRLKRLLCACLIEILKYRFHRTHFIGSINTKHVWHKDVKCCRTLVVAPWLSFLLVCSVDSRLTDDEPFLRNRLVRLPLSSFF